MGNAASKERCRAWHNADFPRFCKRCYFGGGATFFKCGRCCAVAPSALLAAHRRDLVRRQKPRCQTIRHGLQLARTPARSIRYGVRKCARDHAQLAGKTSLRDGRFAECRERYARRVSDSSCLAPRKPEAARAPPKTASCQSWVTSRRFFDAAAKCCLPFLVRAWVGRLGVQTLGNGPSTPSQRALEKKNIRRPCQRARAVWRRRVTDAQALRGLVTKTLGAVRHRLLVSQ